MSGAMQTSSGSRRKHLVYPSSHFHWPFYVQTAILHVSSLSTAQNTIPLHQERNSESKSCPQKTERLSTLWCVKHDAWTDAARNGSVVTCSEDSGKEIVFPTYCDIPTRSCASLCVSISENVDHESGCLGFSLENPSLRQVCLNEHSPDSSKAWLQLALDFRTEITKKTRN